jgi:uncharacterized protein YigE (DUF2233 family)
VRNGIGILPDGNVLMAVSKGGVNFHAFAQWFLEKGCRDALFLDGSVSEYWEPGRSTFGKFGVMIGVAAK